MKYAIRIGRDIGCAIAVAVSGVSAVGVPTLPPGEVPARQSAPAATVNGVVVTQAALDAALAAGGRQGAYASRREFAQRVIACEVLRQAARKAQRREAGQGPSAPLTVSPSGALVCSAEEIRPYVRQVVRPAPVTESEVRASYAALARARPASRAGRAQAEYAQTAQRLRARMQAERLDDAIRALAERLVEQADIEQ